MRKVEHSGSSLTSLTVRTIIGLNPSTDLDYETSSRRTHVYGSLENRAVTSTRVGNKPSLRIRWFRRVYDYFSAFIINLVYKTVQHYELKRFKSLSIHMSQTGRTSLKKLRIFFRFIFYNLYYAYN